MAAKEIETARRSRGVPRGTITRLAKKLKGLESRPGDPSILPPSKQLLKSLETADSEFKQCHLALIDLLETEDDLTKEQAVLDEHAEIVDDLLTRVDLLINSSTVTKEHETRRIVTKRLQRLQGSLSAIRDQVTKLETTPEDVCIIRQHEEQLHELKQELNDTTRSLLSLDLDDKDEPMVLQSALELSIFNNSLKLKRIRSNLEKTLTPTMPESCGVKLPKIAVPTFDGNIIAWKTFWEQFSVAVHSRSDMSDAEKLVYLRHSVKDGSAKNVIEGLSRSGDNYNEAVECLKSRYDRPRLIHQTHVKRILDIPSLKSGSGKELRLLHDTAQQKLRALKSMACEPSGPFITSILELKLDSGTMFEWQRYSSDSADTPHYNTLLEFINLQAQASKNSVARSTKRTQDEVRKNFVSKSLPTYTANITPSAPEPCVVCKTASHPLYICRKIKALPHEHMMAVVKTDD